MLREFQKEIEKLKKMLAEEDTEEEEEEGEEGERRKGGGARLKKSKKQDGKWERERDKRGKKESTIYNYMYFQNYQLQCLQEKWQNWRGR